ncbi:MAG: HEPN domain-containing protein [Anaerolineae bacterium]|jgi:HEPN domain-containing protein|nr:HEPN domain-containing protein [Anaerolineae bacterium]
MNPLLEEARAWLRKARSDLLSARVLVEHSPLVLGPAAFHCQQAAEKTLKAFLISRSVPFERVHSLVYLVDLCKVQDPAFASLRETTESLAPYAVEIRYPGDAPDISLDEARKAVADAEEVWMFVLARLPSALQSEIPGEEQ